MDGWGSKETYIGCKEGMLCQSVGFVMHETEKSLYLALNYCHENNTASDSMCILKATIVKKQKLKV
jgi:hypothetical protein